MTESNLDTLVVCWDCKKIKIDDGPNGWLIKEGNEMTYDSLMKQYEDRLTQGLCKPCEKSRSDEINQYSWMY